MFFTSWTKNRENMKTVSKISAGKTKILSNKYKRRRPLSPVWRIRSKGKEGRENREEWAPKTFNQQSVPIVLVYLVGRVGISVWTDYLLIITINMSYDRIPPDFMRGIFVAPHNFSDPENPTHGEYVNTQIKYDLYNNILYKITGCEFSLFGSAEEELQVTQIKKCEGDDPLWGIGNRIGSSNHS